MLEDAKRLRATQSYSTLDERRRLTVEEEDMEKVFAKSKYPLRFDDVSRRLMSTDVLRLQQEHHSQESMRDRSRKKIAQILERLRNRLGDSQGAAQVRLPPAVSRLAAIPIKPEAKQSKFHTSALPEKYVDYNTSEVMKKSKTLKTLNKMRGGQADIVNQEKRTRRSPE